MTAGAVEYRLSARYAMLECPLIYPAQVAPAVCTPPNEELAVKD